MKDHKNNNSEHHNLKNIRFVDMHILNTLKRIKQKAEK